MNTATVAFYRFAYLSLLFVAGYVLNVKLCESFGKSSRSIKVALLAEMGVVFALSCGIIGVTAYNNWTQTSAGYDAGAPLIIEPAERLRVAYAVIFFFSVLATSALSILTVVGARSKQISGGVGYPADMR